ncbi:MAG: BON domain-containing protein [Thermoanaerobaculia bacterium]|nr:BON domain-containing protein [Thermoanaerobaculia bacterium]
MNRTRFDVAAVVIVVIGLVACAGNINPTRQIDDAVLASNVTDALNADLDLRRYDIVVDAADGSVTLMGTVGSRSDSQRAERIAQGVEGVQAVINELRIE